MFKYSLEVTKQKFITIAPPESRMVSLVFSSGKSHFLQINKKLLIKNSEVAYCYL